MSVDDFKADSKPHRIQLRCAKSWCMPSNTVKVDRSTKWGNPFAVTEDRTQAECVIAFCTWLMVDGCTAGIPERKEAIVSGLLELRGKNLGCWCKPGDPCHADVLLALANQ